MRRFPSAVACAAVLWLAPAVARAQQRPTPPVSDTTSSDSREFTNEQKDVHFIGRVEMNRGDTTIYADDVVVFGDTNNAIATGNVVLAQGGNRLSAERAEFDTETHLGTFYNAWGIANVPPPRQSPRSSAIALPTVIGVETNVYFFGEKVVKLGPKKYKITKGGFSTCVQPTPRWNLNADTVILNVDHYTLLKQAVFSVKGVPMLYMPIFYYPTKRDNRATGFLLPTYGTSTIRGQTLSNAFFWAVDRSEDLTFFHDWFSKVGQGAGSEYRYNFGDGDGNLKAYLLDQHDSTAPTADGTALVPGSRSYEVRGSANQILPHNIRARGRVDYFSSVATMQTFNTNIYDVSRNQRTYGGNLVGAWGTYTLNGTFDHSEYFYSQTQSNVSGSWPRVALSRNERPLFGSELYVSVGSEFAHLLRESKQADDKGAIVSTDTGVTRLDLSPQLRYPFKKWQWLTANSTVGWRETYYTRSLAPNLENPTQPSSTVIDQSLNRQFFTFQTQFVGPVFNRIWDTPDNGYAEKFKHSVEPFLTIQKTTSIDNFNQIVTLDGTDIFVGGTNINYGLNNRFFAKRKLTPGGISQAREIASVELTQTYYTNQQSAQYDLRYTTSQTGAPASHFSALALTVRATPTNDINASVRAEFDSKYRELRTISAQGTYGWGNQLQMTLGWSKKAFIEQLVGFNDPAALDHYINVSANLHTKDNRFGGLYAFNYDVLRSFMVNQRITGFYNAQCCGLALEYQTYNFPPGTSISIIPSDHRFFMSFTLAGLGNFSPFNGALSGAPR
jgi:LPS-assembly protein